jgi:predicted AAA+ superfamily ATPase
MSDRINRPAYLSRLIAYKDTDVVKIVTGIRRCGKSTLLDLFADYLSANGTPQENIIRMNMESLQYRNLSDHLSFYDYVRSKVVKGRKSYLIFDELQAVSQWEKAIESLRLDFDADIYITGSNAYLLSSEFSTLLSGRYVEIRLLPLSFKEFLTFHDFAPDASQDAKFQQYLRFGGMPILSQFRLNEERSFEALEGIYATVILRDVSERNRLSDQSLLHKLVLFLCGNIGSITSPNKIGNVLFAEGDLKGTGGRTDKGVAGKTVERYIRMLRDAFVFYSVDRYDVKGKQLMKTLGKNYIVDTGFRSMLLGYRDADRGHILENAVYLELLRREYRVRIGKVGETEVDFVAEKPAERLYIQVTETMKGETARERELRPLRAIRDNYEKIVLSMDRDYVNSYDGIRVMHVIDFLLDA